MEGDQDEVLSIYRGVWRVQYRSQRNQKIKGKASAKK